jgi:hypothetical protein
MSTDPFLSSACSCSSLVPLTSSWSSLISIKSWYAPHRDPFEITQSSERPLQSKTGVKGFSKETKELEGADLLISITDFIGGVILIYRCWLLWSKNYWIIILPSLTSIGSLGKVPSMQSLSSQRLPTTRGVRFICFIACIGVVLARIDPNSLAVPQYLLSLALAGFVLPLCSNAFITALIAARIWYLSPRKARDVQGTRFPADTGRAAIDIVVESGMLYLVVQFIFVVLFALRHPAQDIAGMVAVQIYVRNSSLDLRGAKPPL